MARVCPRTVRRDQRQGQRESQRRGLAPREGVHAAEYAQLVGRTRVEHARNGRLEGRRQRRAPTARSWRRPECHARDADDGAGGGVRGVSGVRGVRWRAALGSRRPVVLPGRRQHGPLPAAPQPRRRGQ
eukprot:1893620-Prymnesium_polylepis.1